MALLALPVVWLDHATARGAWLLLSVCSLAGAVTVLTRDALSRRAVGVMPALVVALLSPSVFANLRTGQAYLFVFALATLLTASLPWIAAATWAAYPTYVLDFIARPSTSSTAYQTTEGFVRRLCVADPRWNPAPAADCSGLASWLPGVLTCGAMAITLFALRRARWSHVIAAAACLSLLVVPIAEDHHFVLLSLALFFLLPAEPRLVGGWPLVVAALLVMVPPAWTIERFTDGWWALLAYPRLYAAWLVWVFTLVSSAPDSMGAVRDVSH